MGSSRDAVLIQQVRSHFKQESLPASAPPLQTLPGTPLTFETRPWKDITGGAYQEVLLKGEFRVSMVMPSDL